jgi:hypothetical protein
VAVAALCAVITVWLFVPRSRYEHRHLGQRECQLQAATSSQKHETLAITTWPRGEDRDSKRSLMDRKYCPKVRGLNQSAAWALRQVCPVCHTPPLLHAPIPKSWLLVQNHVFNISPSSQTRYIKHTSIAPLKPEQSQSQRAPNTRALLNQCTPKTTALLNQSTPSTQAYQACALHDTLLSPIRQRHSELRELHQHLCHLITTLPAPNIDHTVTVGVLTQGLADNSLAATKSTRNRAGP